MDETHFKNTDEVVNAIHRLSSIQRDQKNSPEVERKQKHMQKYTQFIF